MREKFAERLGGKLCPNRYYDLKRLATIRGKLSHHDKERCLDKLDIKTINGCNIFDHEYGIFSHHYPYYLMYIVSDPVFDSEEHYQSTIRAINHHFMKFSIRISDLSDSIPTTWVPGRTRLLVYERAIEMAGSYDAFQKIPDFKSTMRAGPHPFRRMKGSR
jgi:hypothetical protein